MTDADRQTGLTTRQMLEAPLGAVFVWCNGHTRYAVDLASKLGRGDLEIVSPSWFERDRFRGRRFSGIVVDHATDWTSRQYDGYREAMFNVAEDPKP